MAKKAKRTISEAKEFINDESWVKPAIKELEHALNEIDKQPEIQLVKVSPKVPFDNWFSQKIKTGKAKYWQDAAIFRFFQKNGLSSLETADLYEEVFKKF